MSSTAQPPMTVTVSGIQQPTCMVCGGPHYVAACPDVKEVHYDEHGHIKAVVKR